MVFSFSELSVWNFAPMFPKSEISALPSQIQISSLLLVEGLQSPNYVMLREGQGSGVPALLADPIFSLHFTSEELSAVNSLVFGGVSM